MVKKIKTQMPVRKVGSSMYLLLDKNLRDSLQIKHGTVLEVIMKNLEAEKVRCPRCQNEFYTDEGEEVVDCNVCDAEITESEKEVIEE